MGEISDGRRREFAPRRLRMARDLAGVSQRTLAQATGLSVASISLYENGGATPSDKTIAVFADRLDVGTGFFYTSITAADTPAFFRSLRTTRALDRRRARHRIEVLYELVKTLETKVMLPYLDVPENPVSEGQEEGPEEAARLTREKWDVPPGPIDHMVRSVERHGVVVAQPVEENTQIGAYSVNFPDRPIIVMSLAKGKHDRCRFDVAHELGHLVMHDPSHATTRLVEQQAHQFAAEYLMPAKDIFPELENAQTLDALRDLKREWRVSLAALVRRRYDLNIIDKSRYTHHMKAVSARGWRRNEPDDLGKPEQPVLLRAAMQLASFTEYELAQHTGFTVSLIQNVLNIDTRLQVRI